MKKIYVYGYFKGNLGDDLMLYNLVKEFPNEVIVILGKRNFLYDDLESKVQTITFSELFKNKPSKFIFLGGSTIPKIKTIRHAMLYPLIYLKIIFTLLYLRLIGCKTIFLNTNVYDGKFYSLVLYLYSLVVKEFYVRDIHSLNKLQKCGHKKTFLINDTVENLDFLKWKSLEGKIGFSIVETESIEYIDERIKELEQHILSKNSIYIQFQETEKSKYINNKLLNINPSLLIVEYKNINTTMKEIGKCEFFYGDRFHSMIIANKFDVDLEMQNYDSKIKNYLSGLLSDENRISHSELIIKLCS